MEKNESGITGKSIYLFTGLNDSSAVYINSDFYTDRYLTGMNTISHSYSRETFQDTITRIFIKDLKEHNFSGTSDINNKESYAIGNIQNADRVAYTNRKAENELMNYSNSILKKLNFNKLPHFENTAPSINDIQTIAFLLPESGDTISFGSIIIPQVNYTNIGSSPGSNIPVVFKIVDSTGNEIYNQTAFIESINTSDTVTVNFPEIAPQTVSGNYVIKSFSELEEDQNRENDTITGSITISPILNDIQPAAFVMPFSGDTLSFGAFIMPVVSFRNNGSVTKTNIPVRYIIKDSTGNEVYNRTSVISSIEPDEIINISFMESDSMTVAGIYTITAISELPGDQISSNDSIFGSINVLPFQGNPAFNVTWIDRPVNFQLYARESDDSGIVYIHGVINNSGAYYDTCLTKVFKNDSLIKTTYQLLSYAGDNSVFSLTEKIKAERSEYKITFSLRKPSGSGDTLLYTADSIVAGDTYLINGQSNVFFAPTDGGLLNFKNEYIRTFGIQTDSLNFKTYNAKDTMWKSSYSYFTIHTLSEGHPGNVGGIGQFLQRYILDTFNIPTCIINGSVNNTSIKSHTRNNLDPAALNTIYGKMLYRTQKAKLESKIKAIIWFQGESDNSYSSTIPSLFNPRGTTDPYGYSVYFDSLYKGWVADYDFEKVYVFQIRQVACAYQNRQSIFREVQRQFQTTYHDTVQIIPTVGIGNRAGDNCHYLASGYDQLAHSLFRRLRQDFYSITDSVDMKPPNIIKAFYASFDNKKIGMLFGGSNPGSIPSDSLNRNIKNYFYLNDVRTSTALSLIFSNDTLILTMPESQSAAYLNYLPNQDSLNIYNGPFIRNSKGIAMLTFDSVYIEPYNGLPQNDIHAYEFLIPITGDTISYGTTVTPMTSFKNNGTNPQSNVPVSYRISDSTGNIIYNDSAIISFIDSAETLTVNFPESTGLTSEGNYSISSYCKLTGDQVTNNDSIFGSITVAPLMNDIQNAAFVTPLSGDTLDFGSVISPKVLFTNNGLNPQTNVPVSYRISDSTGNIIYNDSAVISFIDSAETLTVNFPESTGLTSAGNYSISSYCNLTGDQVTNNDSIFGSITVAPPTIKYIELRFYLEYIFPNFDTVKVYLANSVSPFQIIDSSTVFSSTDSLNYITYPAFVNIEYENSYYIIIRHRNSIETWSAFPVTFTSDTILYNFTSSADMTFGSNTKLTGINYCIYSGDKNQDGIVDLSDVSEVSNAANTFLTGYEKSDMNGDNVTDLEDIVLTSNGAGAFIVKITP